MSYQTFHGVGGGPFRPNKDRGLWANPHDFALACLNNAMRVDNIYGIAVVPMMVQKGFFYVLLLFCNSLLYAVPICLIQSFLGQFSSSGHISALRISPLFKGLGVVALALNIISLAFHGVLIAIPMMFFLHSLQPTLPWSCEAPHPWDRELRLTVPTNGTFFEVDIFKSHCNLNYSATDDELVALSVPSVEFFRHQLSDFNIDIFACVLIVWAAVAYTAYQCLEKIGVYFRKCTIVVLSLLVVLFIRMLFLPDIMKHLATGLPYYSPSSWTLSLIMPAIMTFMTFGPGCGSVLTLASYNKFKTDIVKFSWQIPLCQLVILMLLGMVSFCAEMHLIKNQSIIQPLFEHQWLSFMTIPSTLATMDFGHLWTWLFLIMIILGAFNLTFVIAAVVLLAVAMGVQSSLITGVPALGLGVNGLGLGYSGLGYNGLAYNNLGLGLAGQSLVQGPAYGAYGAGIISAAQIPAAVNVAVPQVYTQQAYVPQITVARQVAVAQPAVIAAPVASYGATYVAKNRGAIHTAPLPGHINSAASINVAPAPGTW